MLSANARTAIGSFIGQSFSPSHVSHTEQSREQVESDLQYAVELLRAIVDTSPFATMAFDKHRKLVLWNPAAARIFGWQADEVLGKPFPAQAIPKEDRASSSARIKRTLAGAPVNGDRVRRFARDGRELTLEIYGAALHDRDGSPIGYAGQMIDVTDVRKVEDLHNRRQEIVRRQVLVDTLAGHAFEIVYQPIVELGSGDLVGHEALTRFHSGERPYLPFADAWALGLGAELELATLAAAVEGARKLPAGRWLNVNMSPRLLMETQRLRRVLRAADRPIVIEITEHETVDDYGAIREAIRSLGDQVRVAVDDAGAGVANFAHIIELGPDFVKLDTSVVRGVNANLGRQALVVGMRHFARTAGCRLVAEGVETAEEARVLTELGVEFGQGYWFGLPEPAPRS